MQKSREVITTKHCHSIEKWSPLRGEGHTEETSVESIFVVSS